MSAARSTLRVLIVDDHPVVRQGIALLLLAASDIEVAGMAVDGREALDQVESLEPDVILMDIRMPEMDGIEATRRILERRPEARILVLSGSEVDERVREALSVGAVGYVPKNADGDALAEKIRAVCP